MQDMILNRTSLLLFAGSIYHLEGDESRTVVVKNVKNDKRVSFVDLASILSSLLPNFD